MHTVATITGIRPDFIRMSEIFRRLDQHFHHVLIHTGQHYDQMLSGAFFDELKIRKPDYTLNAGVESSNHYEQLSYLSRHVTELVKKINPELVIFLGDSNTVSVSVPLKKEGFKICHIEAGMRSYDRRMLEEINRTVCDVCSDLLFVYHEDYRAQLAKENITQNVFVVGNTIVEVCQQFLPEIQQAAKGRKQILVDIHRPENFNYPERVAGILKFANRCAKKYQLPVKLLYFKRLKDVIERCRLDLGAVEMIDLMSFRHYLRTVYHSPFIISDSGTAQEEPALLGTPVVVPRDFTERPQSYTHNCSIRLDVGGENSVEVFNWLDKVCSGKIRIHASWLGQGNTASLVIDRIRDYLYQRGVEQSHDMLNNFELTPQHYQANQPFPHTVIDQVLHDDNARALQSEILALPDQDFDRYENPFENKYTLRSKEDLPPQLNRLFDFFTSERFVKLLSDLTGYELVNDPNKNFWGVHKYQSGDKLDLHVDAGQHPVCGLKKQVTLGLYLSRNWEEQYGGHLELWEGDNAKNNDAKLTKCRVRVAPIFNRMVIFTNNDVSWHGNPDPVVCPSGAWRIFVTLSYLSHNRDYENKKAKAFFVARPSDPVDPVKDELRLLRADPERCAEVYRYNQGRM